MSGEDPIVSDISINPTTLTAGQTDVTISVRITSSLDVTAVAAEQPFGWICLGSQDGGDPRSVVWTGTLFFPLNLADGNYNVHVQLDIGHIRQPNTIIIGNVLLARYASTGIHDRLTTFTFRGPVTVRNTTSQSGECEIRISVRGPVTVDYE